MIKVAISDARVKFNKIAICITNAPSYLSVKVTIGRDWPVHMADGNLCVRAISTTLCVEEIKINDIARSEAKVKIMLGNFLEVVTDFSVVIGDTILVGINGIMNAHTFNPITVADTEVVDFFSKCIDGTVCVDTEPARDRAM